MPSCFGAPTRPSSLVDALRACWTRLHASAVLVGVLLLASVVPVAAAAGSATHRPGPQRDRRPLLVTTTLALQPTAALQPSPASLAVRCRASRHPGVNPDGGALRDTLCLVLPRPRHSRPPRQPRHVAAVAAAATPAPSAPPLGLAAVRSIVVAAAARHGVASSWLLRVAMCESGLNPSAYNASSGASGLFQFMPSTFYGNGGHDLWSAYQQADVAAAMFAAGESSAWACA